MNSFLNFFRPYCSEKQRASRTLWPGKFAKGACTTIRQLLVLLSLQVIGGGVFLNAQDTPAGLNLMRGDFESGTPSFNPWGGVDENGNIHVWAGSQLAVADSGAIGNELFSPSVAVGDLNGDGLPDLVVADARGFFWYFQNTGKPDAPAFSHGEIMPIWLGDDWHDGDVVPRIQLIDYNESGKLGVVAGNYYGQLYFIPNLGSSSDPNFRLPRDRTSLQVPTHSGHQLWRNYLAPFLFDWTGSHRFDLILGDGSYSANSIYMLTNKGSSESPRFSENDTAKLIPGMGREHLTPQVVDWNNDGKPDIICGERAGYINVYLNQADDKSSPPVFDMDHPQHVMFGATDKIGALTTVCAADLNHDGLFDLVVSGVDGRISYALNKGTPGNPQFGELVPITGVSPYPRISTPTSWAIERFIPFGSPYEMLECTNAEMEKGFVPPPDFKGKGALKFSIVKPQATYFKEPYVPDDLTRRINYTNGIILQTDADYHFNVWTRTTGNVYDIQWHMDGIQRDQTDPASLVGQSFNGKFSNSSSWDQSSDTFEVRSKFEGQKNVNLSISLFLTWQGDGTLYFDNFSFVKAQ
jgi:hypothetical protein